MIGQSSSSAGKILKYFWSFLSIFNLQFDFNQGLLNIYRLHNV